jgi:Na+/H+ antiporter NhaD/arsenite permease-like protein
MPFLIAQILASNIGGMATLIGDPPNILIASAAGIDFVTFAANMAPLSIMVLLVFFLLCRFMFGKDLSIGERRAFDLGSFEPSALITDPRLLFKSLVVMAIVIVGFLAHGFLHLEPATIAMFGATVLILWGKRDPDHVFRDVEWATLFFFIGLFITVEALVHVGIIASIATSLLRLTGGNLPATTMLILWLSALASGIVDNIPYTATMIPVVKDLSQSMPVGPLWWALAAGADLGGNATLVGASANVVVASLAERSGHPIGFRTFLRYGVPTTFLSLVIATVYIWVRYL